MQLEKIVTILSKETEDLIDTCSHCGAKVHIVKLWGDYHTCDNGDLEYYFTFRCKPCRKILVKVYSVKKMYADYELNGWSDKFPTIITDQLIEDDKVYLPEQVASDYKEAMKCQDIRCYKASCAMFRRCLQNALVNLGADASKDLIHQIGGISILDSSLQDWAHQIRIFGNWGAHPSKDELKDVDDKITEDVHNFISNFLNYAFIMPEKVKSARKKRET